MDARREKIAKLVIRTGKKIKDVARQYGISPSTVRRYMDEYTEKPTTLKDADIRDLAARIVGQAGRYHGEGNLGHNYSVSYDQRTFYSDCTNELADKLAEYIKENDKT